MAIDMRISVIESFPFPLFNIILTLVIIFYKSILELQNKELKIQQAAL